MSTDHNPFCTEVTREWKPPNDPEYLRWQEERRQYLGASDTAAALGHSKWVSPYSLWLTKLGHKQPTLTTEPMHWGNQHEPLIIQEGARLNSLEVLATQVSFVHPRVEFMRCHVDATVRGSAWIEAKQVSGFQETDWDRDDPPMEYHIQIAHTFACTGYLECYLIALFGGNHLRTWRIKRDEQFVSAVEHQAEQWWREHIIEGNEPAMTGHDDCKRSIQEQFPAKDVLPEIDLSAHASLLKTRDQAVEMAAQYANAKDTADNELRRLMGSHTIAKIGDRKVTYRENKRGVRSLRVGKAK